MISTRPSSASSRRTAAPRSARSDAPSASRRGRCAPACGGCRRAGRCGSWGSSIRRGSARAGGAVLALVLLQVEPAREREVIAELAGWEDVTYISSLVGRYDVYAQLLCRDNEALWDVVRRLRALPGVVATETVYETEVHKFAYRDVATRRR